MHDTVYGFELRKKTMRSPHFFVDPTDLERYQDCVIYSTIMISGDNRPHNESPFRRIVSPGVEY